jgi:hypothetical protein
MITIEGWSVFVGIVAGAFVQYGMTVLDRFFTSRRIVDAAAFELRYIATVKGPEWATQLAKVRQHVNERRPEAYVAFIDLARAPTPALNALINSGFAYRKLGPESLSALLDLLNSIALSAQTVFNDRVEKVRSNQNIPAALAELDFLENRTQDLRKKASELHGKLSKGKSP